MKPIQKDLVHTLILPIDLSDINADSAGTQALPHPAQNTFSKSYTLTLPKEHQVFTL